MPLKLLASVAGIHAPEAQQFMQELNRFARDHGLQEYDTYSRIWEYPWLWFRLRELQRRNLTLLDIGSETSPFPWFLATRGFRVIVSDVTARWWDLWSAVNRQLGGVVAQRIVDSQDTDLGTASVDICLSVSVIEHVPDKRKVIAETARILRPGGLLLMTYDICEPDRGMTFPEWNGRALSMGETDALFRDSEWFEPGLAELPWNSADIPEYLAWHRTTAPHHNYVTGAARVERNGRAWSEDFWRGPARAIRASRRALWLRAARAASRIHGKVTAAIR